MDNAFKHAWPWLALASFLIAMALAGLDVPEYSHWRHPLALRGATGLPGAWLFNAGAFWLPGLMLAYAGGTLRPALAGRGGVARIGLTLVQGSALAFAAQGLLPLDLRQLDAPANRLHALAWMLWWLSFVPGARLLALRGRHGPGFAALSLVAAAGVPLLALLVPIAAWVGPAQRLAFLLWFGWWLLAGRWLSRSAVSGPGSAPPART